MNTKKIFIIFFICLSLFMTISAISAEENMTESVPENSEETSDIEVSHDVVSPEAGATDGNAQITEKQTTIIKEKSKKNVLTAAEEQTTVKKEKSKKKILTETEASPIASKYKSNTYFKVKVEDKYDDDIPIKKVKIKLKVFTGSKSKTYIIKTNNKGVAKFNTKNLKIGTHKVIISSGDDRYKITKTSKIIIGKQYSTVLKSTSSKKVLKTKDSIYLKYKDDFDEKEVKVLFKKKAKHTIITKAKFYFKNKITGKIVTKVDNCEFDDGRWEVPDKDYPYRYTLLKVKVWYIKV